MLLNQARRHFQKYSKRNNSIGSNGYARLPIHRQEGMPWYFVILPYAVPQSWLKKNRKHHIRLNLPQPATPQCLKRPL